MPKEKTICCVKNSCTVSWPFLALAFALTLRAWRVLWSYT